MDPSYLALSISAKATALVPFVRVVDEINPSVVSHVFEDPLLPIAAIHVVVCPKSEPV